MKEGKREIGIIPSGAPGRLRRVCRGVSKADFGGVSFYTIEKSEGDEQKTLRSWSHLSYHKLVCVVGSFTYF